MSRRNKHRYEVKEVDFTPAPIKKNTWADAWMDYIIWGAEGDPTKKMRV